MMEDDKHLTTRDIAKGAADEQVKRDERRRVETEPDPKVAPAGDREYAALFEEDEARGFRARWEAIQTGFVDEPRTAVEQADALVAQLMKRLAEVFSDERSSLEQQWDRGDKISTEDLRVALKRYRSFFERLLSL